MTDDVSPGEVFRRLKDHEERTDRVHAALDSRVTDVAKSMVPLDLYNRGERDRDRDMDDLSKRVDKLEERPGMTISRWLGILTVAAAFLALAVQAYGTMKGAK